MSEYISREAAEKVFSQPVTMSMCLTLEECKQKNAQRQIDLFVIRGLPAADVVSRGAYDQTDWERCVALTQLKEVGKSLGERMDDVRPVVRGKWIDHQEGRWIYAKCSECGTVHDVKSNFCPNCGADMREGS